MNRPIHLNTAALLCAAALGLSNPAHAGLVTTVLDAFGLSGARSTYVENSNGQSFRSRITGTVEFTEAEDDVSRLSGRLTILDKRAGITRMIDFKSDASAPGGIRKTYRINNTDATIDAAATQWIAESIKRIARETAANVEPRVKRLLAQGGVSAVLSETDRIASDHSRGRHLLALLGNAILSSPETEQFLRVSRAIDSDYEKRNVLAALIGRQPLLPGAQIALLNQVAGMDSSYEQRQVLEALAPALATGEGVSAAWRSTMRAVDSDYEKRQIAEALSKGASLNADAIERIIAAASEIDSDYERASALISLSRHFTAPTALQVQAFVACAREIDSDYEKARVLNALLRQAKLDAAGYAAVIGVVRNFDSDHEAGNVLTQIARRMPADADLVAAYRKAARQLGDYERMEAEKALDRLAL